MFYYNAFQVCAYNLQNTSNIDCCRLNGRHIQVTSALPVRINWDTYYANYAATAELATSGSSSHLSF